MVPDRPTSEYDDSASLSVTAELRSSVTFADVAIYLHSTAEQSNHVDAFASTSLLRPAVAARLALVPHTGTMYECCYIQLLQE